jgi:poly-gamma-glutamate capsule biosynthesis protein CapA/YwtB (metallophosphatase superfamily)
MLRHTANGSFRRVIPYRIGAMGVVSRLPAAAVLALAAACTSGPVAETRRAVPTQTASATMPSSTAPVPSPAAGRKQTLLVHAVGDVSLDPNHVSGLAKHGFAHAWTGVDGLFTRDDLTIANIECSVARGGVPQAKRYRFLCSPDGLSDMRNAGIDVGTLANNHSADYGVPAMLDSMANLRGAGIAATGAGATAAEAYRPAFLERGGRRIAVIGLSQIAPRASWYAAKDRPGVASGHDLKAAGEAVRSASREADLVIVFVHWGIERSPEPSAVQRRLARHLIEAGADAIFGCHPHVLQPLEFYNERPIFYSLGNFVWARSWPASYRTAVAEVRFGDRIEAKLLPAYIESSGHPVLQ